MAARVGCCGWLLEALWRSWLAGFKRANRDLAKRDA